MWARCVFVVILAAATAVCAAGASLPQQFWSDFRQAALASDYGKLIVFAAFLLELRSEVDGTAPRSVEKEEFESTLKHVFDQPMGELRDGQLETYTMRDLIAKTPDLDGESVSAESFQVGQLLFAKRKGGWRLVAAYLNE